MTSRKRLSGQPIPKLSQLKRKAERSQQLQDGDSSSSDGNFYRKTLQMATKDGLLVFARHVCFNPQLMWIVAIGLFCTELVFNLVIIHKVKYTEIDWIAYMQEVGGFLNGTLDYTQLRGDTGPLVYPSGFVYFYSVLYYLTSRGSNVRLAQYMFAVFYLTLLLLVFRIYWKSKKVPPYALFFMCLTSYRIHSIFVLRLFNDPIAMIFFYAALNCFISNRWSIGSTLYSLAVSLKMNVLLFAPALLLAYLATQGPMGTVKQLSICAAIQVVLALPFLCVNPVGYVQRSFDIGRVFLHEWTVNWRFLPEEIFVDRRFHLLLLALHLIVIALFAKSWWRYLKSFAVLQQTGAVDESSQLLLLPMFVCNLIGITFSRSLHYQFYVWYYHSLAYLVWSIPLSPLFRILVLGVIELCWNTFPSTVFSSVALHGCHVFIVCSLFLRRQPNVDAARQRMDTHDQQMIDTFINHEDATTHPETNAQPTPRKR